MIDEMHTSAYADPPSVNPELTAAQRRSVGRNRRHDAPFESVVALRGSGTDPWSAIAQLHPESSSGLTVLATGPRATVQPVSKHGLRRWDFSDVDDMLPMSFEVDLIAHGVRLAAMVKRRDRHDVVERFFSAYSKALFESLDQQRSDWSYFGDRYSASLGRVQLAKLPRASFTSFDCAVSTFVRPSDVSLRIGRLARWWGVDREDLSDDGGSGIDSEFAQYRETLSDADATSLSDYRVAQHVPTPQGDVLVLLLGVQKGDLMLMFGRTVRESPFEKVWGLWRQGSDIQRVLVARSAVPIMLVEYTGWSTSSDGTVGRVWSRFQWGPPLKPRSSSHRYPSVDLQAFAQGACLGLSHARTGDAWALAGYLGKSHRSARTLARAVVTYTG